LSLRIHHIVVFLLLNFQNVWAQNNGISIRVALDKDTHTLHIQQKITYYNHSQDTLNCIYLHDWNNAFSHKNTALGKRLIENYHKNFFFAKEKDRGFTSIKDIIINNEKTNYERLEDNDDFIKIAFNHKLKPHDSIKIQLRYSIKIPNAKFTSYGRENNNYNLRYWHLVPVIYDGTWQLMHHLNMDDLSQNPTDYSVQLNLPEEYIVASNLQIEEKSNTEYLLTGTNLIDFQLHLSLNKNYQHFQTDKIIIATDLKGVKIEDHLKTALLNRQIAFLQKHLGEFPYQKLFINKTSYYKNPLYGINQLPSFLSPFPKTFTWDLQFFKVLSQEYINASMHSQNRKNTWLKSGMQTFMMMQYVNEFYPEIKLIGGISKLWGIRSYQIANLNFNDRYSTVYQHTAKLNRDQALTTPTDSLTNFNRLIFQKHKAGLALKYLDDYIGEGIVAKALQNSFKDETNKDKNEVFREYISSHTNKEISWFFNDFLHTDKKIDYTLKRIKINKDSIKLTIKNKRNLSTPISLYGINKKGIQTKQWFVGVTDKQSIIVAKDSIKSWVLNYKNIIPEINLRNNKVNSNWSLLKKPLKIRWLTDADDPNINQLFLEPKTGYNLYDGLLLATSIKNESLLRKNLTYSFIPAYSIKNQTLTGAFKMIYHKYLENDNINSYRIGIGGSYFHYQPSLVYKKLTPFAQIFFKRKNLRSVKNSSLSLGYTLVDKEVDLSNNVRTEYDKYSVLRLSYRFHNPEIIKYLSYSTNVEIGQNFSKLTADIRYRLLTNHKQQFGMRLFVGTFLHNNTNSDFFSFGVNRPNDYLFRYNYFGRNETKGFFSQQIIINDGGFVSQIPVSYANQWLTSFQTSVGIWRWFEIYNNVGFAKNRSQSVYFIHDKGVRLNFVNDIFELYFPVHSNNGWEIAQPHYEERIRFVFKADFTSIYNFLKRGFF